MLDNQAKTRKPSSWRSKPILSIRARLLVLALLAIAPLVFDRVQGLELSRSHRIDRARAEVIDLARRGTESQREIIYSVRALLQIVARAYAKIAARGGELQSVPDGAHRQRALDPRLVGRRSRRPHHMLDRVRRGRIERVRSSAFSECAAFP